MTKINTSVEQEPSSQRLVFSMAIAGFISGIIIIAIYMLTFDTIKENKARELRQAVFKVLPNVQSMQKLYVVNNKLEVVDIDGMDDDMIFAGYNKENKFIGYAIQGKGPGFQDTVHVLFGYIKSQDVMTGMEILDSRETPGLGDKIFKDMHFVGEFMNLSMKKTIKAVKKGTKQHESEIDAITGATISSKAVVRIMNKAFERWSKYLPEQGNEPQYVEASVKPSSVEDQAIQQGK